MTQEDKELLLKYLSAALPYEVIVKYKSREKKGNVKITCGNIGYVTELGNGWWKECKPYLRPMSSMTEEENKEFESIWDNGFGKALDAQISNFDDCVIRNLEIIASSNAIDWLNAHYFDYRGLIEKGLAIAVTEKNNPYK